MVGYILTVIYILACFVLIFFVLLQPGKADASAVFGGGINSAAFGPRGTQSVLAKVTIGAAIIFFMIAFLFSIPGLFDKRSLGEGVGPAESATPPPPISVPAPTDSGATPQPAQPAAAPGAAGDKTDAAKPGAKPADAKPAAAKDAGKKESDKK